MSPSLYIHIPVCLQKCSYCDFYSITLSSLKGNTSSLISALIRDIKESAELYKVEHWQSVYIGGGTPSLLDNKDVLLLGKAIKESCNSGLLADCEWTIEANPEDINESWLNAAQEAGINRLSIGVQSLNDEVLGKAGRRGSADNTRSAFKLIHTYWQGDISCDVISGLPSQSIQSLKEDLDEIIEWKSAHISLYALSLEQGTPLYTAVNDGSTKIGNEDEQADVWIAGKDHLLRAGYQQYEVSNFAQNGFECKHNMRYWEMESWLAAGPSSTAMIFDGQKATRITVDSDVQRWMSAFQEERTNLVQIETIEGEMLISEILIMGFRLAKGIDKRKFKARFYLDLNDVIGNTCKRWKDNGYLTENSESAQLTSNGLLFLNRFLIECLDELHDFFKKRNG